MTDYYIFTTALNDYLNESQDCSDDVRDEKYAQFQDKIQDLECNDFRLYLYRAMYLNSKNAIPQAKLNIDKAIELSYSVVTNLMNFGENGEVLYVPNQDNSSYFVIDKLPSIKAQFSQLFLGAGEIYAKIGDDETSLKYYQIGHYYGSFLKPDFDTDSITVFSFRRYNEYSLSDLINNTITVCPSTYMNDPLDSVINLWADEERLEKHCDDKKHIKPYCLSFNYYRIRAFCLGLTNKPIKNILMWSHYAGEHSGFCVKYKLSKHFISQSENTDNEHMYLKRINYTNMKIDVETKSINSNLAFATKKKDWKYENEVRLIVYNPNNSAPFYGVELDDASYIEAIYFGYRCPNSTINTIKNIFVHKRNNIPKFFKMVLNDKDIYNLQYIRV